MDLRLDPGALHVWRADLDEVEATPAREVLVELLVGYLGREPAAIELASGEHGKPRLAESEGIEFNLSHSGELAVFAFTRENPVGIDVELNGRVVRDPIAVAEREFGPAEAARLRSLSEAEIGPEFLRLWVRHEAAVKCRGEGLAGGAPADPLVLLDVDVGPDATAAVALAEAPEAVSVRRFEWPRSRES